MGASLLSHLNECPSCGQAVLGHPFSLLASMVIIGEDRRHLREFFEALKGRRWAELLAFQEWEGAQDNVELYGLRCESDRVTLVVVRCPFELYDSDKILAIEVLSQEESHALVEFTKGKEWKALSHKT